MFSTGDGDGVGEDDAAMALFRLRRLPALAQLQKQGRVPVGPARLQDDSRECITNAVASASKVRTVKPLFVPLTTCGAAALAELAAVSAAAPVHRPHVEPRALRW